MSESYDLGPISHHLSKLLSQREHPKTLCPSEVARALTTVELKVTGANSWRDLMPVIREHVFHLRDDGKLEILQKGSVLPETQGLNETTGPIRIRRIVEGSEE